MEAVGASVNGLKIVDDLFTNLPGPLLESQRIALLMPTAELLVQKASESWSPKCFKPAAKSVFHASES